MFKRLIIKNFQKHKKTAIELDPTVTTIIGPTDAGKSSILRSLRWVCLNRPSGDAFVRHGQDKVSVEIELDDKSVKRTKGKDVNEYRIQNKGVLDKREKGTFLPPLVDLLSKKPERSQGYGQDFLGGLRGEKGRDLEDGTKTTFKAFGQEVPQEIQEALNVGEVNFQRQMDAPFWLSLSSGEAAKELNSVVNLGLIDRTLALLASEGRKVKAAAEVSEERLQSARERRNNLEWVKDANDKLGNVERLGKEAQSLFLQASRLHELLQEASAFKSKRDRLSETILAGKKAIQAGEAYQEIHEKTNQLSLLLAFLHKTKEEQCQLKSSLTEAKRQLAKALKERCPLCGRS